MSNPLPDTLMEKMDRSYRVSTTTVQEKTRNKWTTGYVITRHGIVGFYQQHRNVLTDMLPFLSMEISRDGNRFRREWDEREFTDIGIVRLANQFMHEARIGLLEVSVHDTKQRYMEQKAKRQMKKGAH